MQRYFLRMVLGLLLCTWTCLEASAWGQTGHRAIAELATHFLTKKAKKKINRILAEQDLALSSTWMDDIRSDSTYDYTRDWHWVTIPDSLSYEQSEKNPNGDIVFALNKLLAALQTDTLSPKQEREYLKMVIHLIGDLHQPLHVGRGDDRGGNNVKVKWMGKNSNLHRVWDSEIINSQQLSYSELSAALLRQTAYQPLAEWRLGSPNTWANEAKQYRSQIYDIGDAEKMGYEYMYQNWGLMQVQLMKAAIRLAHTLNQIYG
jgi:hypothetical protein